MTTEQMVAEMKTRLNRPDEDDLFEFPLAYHGFLSRAHRHFYKLAAKHSPTFLYADITLSSTDGGETFTLTDDHLGEILLFRDPGPPTGRPFLPSLPEGAGHYWQQGRDLKFISPYSGTLYISWIPSTIADLDQDNDSLLPAYFDDAIIDYACYFAAKIPGFLGDPESYKTEAMTQWIGNNEDPSDSGILGIVMRQSAHRAYEGEGSGAWYHGIGG